MKAKVTYEVLSRGFVVGCTKTESAAIAEAKTVEPANEPLVRMVVESGEYKSRTTVWPQLGPTVSL